MTEKKGSKKGVFLRLMRYILQHWPLFLLAMVLTLFANQLSLLGPKYSGEAIDAIAAAGGVDFDTARQMGVKTIWALSLPGKVAPISSGEAIKDTILNILDERRDPLGQ